MVEVNLNSFSVGTIIQYSQAFSEPALADQLKEQDYDIKDRDEQGLNIGPQGVSFGPNPVFAAKDDFQILLNQNADLDGLASSSFVTVKDERRGDYQAVLDEVKKLWEDYDDIDIASECDLVELTMSGYVRVDPDIHSISELVHVDKIESLTESNENGHKGSVVHVQGNKSKDDPGWYRLQLNADAIDNPRRWAFKIIRRYETYKEIDVDFLTDSIESTVDNTKSE